MKKIIIPTLILAKVLVAEPIISSTENVKRVVEEQVIKTKKIGQKIDNLKKEQNHSVITGSLAQAILELKKLYIKNKNDKQIKFLLSYLSILSKPDTMSIALTKNEKYLLKDFYSLASQNSSYINTFSNYNVDINQLTNAIYMKTSRFEYSPYKYKKSKNLILWTDDKQKRRLRENPFLGIKSEAVVLKKLGNNNKVLTAPKGSEIFIYYTVKVNNESWSKIALLYEKKNITGWILNSAIKEVK